MKSLKLLALALLTFIAVSVVNPGPVKAQAKADSAVQIVPPVFDGSEKNLADSLASIGTALQDPALKSTVDNAVTTISNPPAKGSSANDYIAYGLAVLASIIAVYHYVQRKLAAKPK
jgi:hypothetical protein